MKGDILVLAEHNGAEPDNITWELLTKGRALADAWGTQLAVLVIGSALEPLANTISKSGADLVLTAEHPELNDYNAEIYTTVISQAAKGYGPSLFLMGYTYLGMEVGPAVAAGKPWCSKRFPDRPDDARNRSVHRGGPFLFRRPDPSKIPRAGGPF